MQLNYELKQSIATAIYDRVQRMRELAFGDYELSRQLKAVADDMERFGDLIASADIVEVIHHEDGGAVGGE